MKILPDIYSVGVTDWNVREFHGHTYTAKRGSSYNAYLIIDDKVTLVDTVLGSFSEELIRNIRQVLPPQKLDYIIVNHVETDHSGALPAIIKLAPQAKIFGTAKCKEGLQRHYYGNWEMQVVRTGEKLSLGKRTLEFIEAPMVHWPDSMFTYCPEEQLLLPNDAFGQHYATSERFDDEVDSCALMDEAEKYYANILWPVNDVILKKLQDIQKLNISIKMIAPSHGVIWRKHPEKIIEAYLRWARNVTLPKVVVAYETMWGATAKMAGAIADGLIDKGVEVKIFDIANSDRTEVIKEMLDARGLIFGSSTHDNNMLPNIAAFLELIKGIKPKNRVMSVFGSFGWAGGAIKEIESLLMGAGVKDLVAGVGVKYAPDETELKRCHEIGLTLADKVKSA